MALVALVAQGCSDTNAADASGLTVDARTPHVRTALVYFGRSSTPREIPYIVQGEWAVAEGDILLGKVDEVEAQSQALRAEVQRNASPGRVSSQGLGIKSSHGNGFWKWPGAKVPYVIDTTNMTNPGVTVQNIQKAVDHWARRTRIQLVPRTSETDYILFQVDTNIMGGACFSRMGRQGGMQLITFPPAGCDFGGMVHEIGHAVGLFHEHQRPDRDNYITIHLDAVDTATYGDLTYAFKLTSEVPGEAEADTYAAPYDFSSIMHYSEWAFAKSGMKTITPVNPLPSGVVLGQRNGLSEGDIDMIGRMYGSYVSYKYESMTRTWPYPHPLGNPLGAEVSRFNSPQEPGRMRNYENGSIYWHWDTGAFAIMAPFLTRWQDSGATLGPLDYPVSDAIQYSPSLKVQYFKKGRIDVYGTGYNDYTITYGSEVANKYAIRYDVGLERQPEAPALGEGRFQLYTYGSIYWSPWTGVWAVKNPIDSKWAELGREGGPLGYPTSDAITISGGGLLNGGVMNHFQWGDISWSSAYGYDVMVNDLQNSQYEYYSGIKGHVEAVSSAWGLQGWVYDHGTPGSDTEVHFYMDGPSGSGTGYNGGRTNLLRTDVNDAYQLPTGSLHGFQIAIPSQYYDGQPHTVHVYGLDNEGSGHNPLLDRTERSFTFPGAEGHVEGVTGDGRVVGWALDMNSKSTAIAVHFYIDGSSQSGTGYASTTTEARSDVNSLYGATGNHGFSWTIPSQYHDGLTHRVYVYAIDAQGRHNPLLDGRSYSFLLGTPPDPPCEMPCDCTGTCISEAMCRKLCG